MLFRVDGAGRTTPITVTGADVRDWEDVTIGTCPAGGELYLVSEGGEDAAAGVLMRINCALPK
jgi:hypothetical protein